MPHPILGVIMELSESFNAETIAAILEHVTLARTARTYARKATRSATALGADVTDALRAESGEWTHNGTHVATVKAPAQRDDMTTYVADLERAVLALGGTLPTKGTLTSKAALSW